MKLRDWCEGRWPEIVSALVGAEFTNPRKHCPCPRGEGKDRFRFSDRDGRGNYFCHCSEGEKDGFELLQCVHGWDFAETARQIETVIGACPKDGEAELEAKPETWAEKLYREAIRTPKSDYLSSRGLEIPPGVWWHKSVDYFDDDGKRVGKYPAMLSPLLSGGELLTVHVTYLQGGRKADVPKPRKILPGYRSLNGAACPVYPEHAEHLGVAEGVETAIAAQMLFGCPVWAALNTALLKNWQPPEGVEVVTIFGDHDANYAGQAAAYALGHKLAGKDYEVEVAMPDQRGDWNDVLLRKREAAA